MAKIVQSGKKVTLRTPEQSDIPILYSLRYGQEKPEWKNFDAPYFPLDACTESEFQQRIEQKNNSNEIPDEMIIEVEGKIIGVITFYWEYKPTRWLEIGIVIYLPEYWSGGYGSEACVLWIDYLFSQLEIERVGLTTWSGNPRMMRCAEKIGMQLEGRMRKCRYYNGEYYDSIRMGVLRDEWEEIKQRGSHPTER